MKKIFIVMLFLLLEVFNAYGAKKLIAPDMDGTATPANLTFAEIFVLDMDGTVTPANSPIEPDIAIQFGEFVKQNKVFICTGGTLEDVKRQIPKEIYLDLAGVFTTSGNAYHKKDVLVYENVYKFPTKLIENLKMFKKSTNYDGQVYDEFLDVQKAVIYFSVVGLKAPYKEKMKYAKFEEKAKERDAFIEKAKKEFPELTFTKGVYESSINIFPNGMDKGQVAGRLLEEIPSAFIFFVGDRTMIGGNDHALGRKLLDMAIGITIPVKNPADTMQKLKRLNLLKCKYEKTKEK